MDEYKLNSVSQMLGCLLPSSSSSSETDYELISVLADIEFTVFADYSE